MKLWMLVFGIFLIFDMDVLAAVKRQPASAKVYTPDEMEILNELYGEYSVACKDILGLNVGDTASNEVDSDMPTILHFDSDEDEDCEKDDDIEDGIGGSVLSLFGDMAELFGISVREGILTTGNLDKFLPWIIAIYVFFVANRLGAESFGEKWRELDKSKIDRICDDFNKASPEFWKGLGWFMRQTGIGYAFASYVLTGIVFKVFIGVMNCNTGVSFASLEKLENSIKRILSNEHKLGDDLKDAAHESTGVGFVLVDKQVHPEFTEKIISELERDFLLVHDKVMNERVLGIVDGESIGSIWTAFKLACGVGGLTFDWNWFISTFVVGVVLFFVLNHFIFLSRDDRNKSKILGDIYQIIKTAKLKNFEIVKQNVQIKEIEAKNSGVKNDVKPVDSNNGAVSAPAAVAKKSLFARLRGLFSRKKVTVSEKKSEADEIKAEADKVEKDMNVTVERPRKIVKIFKGFLMLTVVVGAFVLFSNHRYMIFSF